jgi:6-pyruvoyltetrahydropterin/6-carboxytetrahydropterin synthase
VRLTRRYQFSASHRLHTPELSDQENRDLYGKCNNPYGHGHDYVVEITVEGLPDESGQIVDRAALDELVRAQVLSQFDHKNLNLDRDEFRSKVPTTENLVCLTRSLLCRGWNLAARLKSVRISETGRNTVTLPL